MTELNSAGHHWIGAQSKPLHYRLLRGYGLKVALQRSVVAKSFWYSSPLECLSDKENSHGDTLNIHAGPLGESTPYQTATMQPMHPVRAEGRRLLIDAAVFSGETVDGASFLG